MTRLPAILLFAALLAVPATAQAKTITIVKPPAQPPVQTVGVKPPLGNNVPVLVDTAPEPQITLDTPLIIVAYPSDEPSDPPSDEPTNPASDDPSDWSGNPLIP